MLTKTRCSFLSCLRSRRFHCMDITKDTIHLFHHSFTRGGGKERYALLLASTFKAMGHPVIFHATFIEDALARARGIEVRKVSVARFPRKLIDYRFFRKLD